MIHVENALDTARKALDANQIAEAERELQGVLDFDEEEPRALRLMGKIARAQGEFQRAAEFFARALEARASHPQETPRAPRAPRLTPTLAELYADQGYPDAAAKVYRQLLNREEEGPRCREWRRRLIELEEGPEDRILLDTFTWQGQEGERMDPPGGASSRKLLSEKRDPEGGAQRLRTFLEPRQVAAHLNRFLRHLGDRISRAR